MRTIKCVNLVLLTGWILSPSYLYFFFFCSTGLFLLWIVTCNNSIYKYKIFKRHSLPFKFFFYRFPLLVLIYICIDHSFIINVFNGHIFHHVFMQMSIYIMDISFIPYLHDKGSQLEFHLINTSLKFAAVTLEIFFLLLSFFDLLHPTTSFRGMKLARCCCL